MEPPPIALIKETYNDKSYEDFVKLELRRDPMSSKSDIYELNMYLFDHGDPEEFLLFIKNLNMTLAASGTLDMDARFWYLCTLVHGEGFKSV